MKLHIIQAILEWQKSFSCAGEKYYKATDVISQLVNHEKLRKQISTSAETWAKKMLSHNVTADKTQYIYEMKL